jgi:hypothetical protein
VSLRLKQLRADLEAAGLKPGTPAFERVEREKKVEMCKQMKSVESCWDCQYFDHCELIKAHLRDIHKVKQK